MPDPGADGDGVSINCFDHMAQYKFLLTIFNAQNVKGWGWQKACGSLAIEFDIKNRS